MGDTRVMLRDQITFLCCQAVQRDAETTACAAIPPGTQGRSSCCILHWAKCHPLESSVEGAEGGCSSQEEDVAAEHGSSRPHRGAAQGTPVIFWLQHRSV